MAESQRADQELAQPLYARDWSLSVLGETA